MVELILIAAAIPAGCALLLWAWGRREQPFVIGAGEAWFVALKRAQTTQAFSGLQVRWSSRADLAFVGADDAYWTDFAIVRGDQALVRQRVDEASAEDAFIARVRLAAPPALAFGVLKALVATGVLSRPDGSITADLSGLGHDPKYLPSPAAIARLRAQPAHYAPAMVNFLAYKRPDGARAYMRYGRVALRTVYRTGGRLLFFGRVREIVLAAKAGPCVGAWDELAAMQYNRPEGILSMEHAPDYRAALGYRDEGLDRTVVIASTPGERV